VAYLAVNLMEDVLSQGTGAGVRARGFTFPAAGKTGTSRDGWFAGFTSELVTVVWVGYDDGSELNLEGSRSALPIWTEFMKRAHRRSPYRNARAFPMPDGIERVEFDPTTGGLATLKCPAVRSELFLSGTAPEEPCPEHEEKGFLQRIWGIFR
jgi:penicillin-binding protein 1B